MVSWVCSVSRIFRRSSRLLPDLSRISTAFALREMPVLHLNISPTHCTKKNISTASEFIWLDSRVDEETSQLVKERRWLVIASVGWWSLG